jgi:hypothetical protein
MLFLWPVVSENSDSRGYHDTRGTNLDYLVNFSWWRGLDDLAKRSETGGRRSINAQSIAAGRTKAQAEPKFGSAWVVGYATKRS